MRVKRNPAIFFLVLSSLGANGVAPSQSELAAMYDKAARELGAGDYVAALQQLDAIDARQPDLAETQNLRGAVLMREGKYDPAEAALHQALEIEPKFFHARFNLAEISFLRKNWAQARDRFGVLLEGPPGELGEAMIPLIHYKILLVILLEEKEEELGNLLSELKGWKKSPAFAYAEAAIAFHHHEREKGRDRMAAAEKHFPAEENKLFLESFYEVGWLPRPAGEPRVVAEFTSPEEGEARSRLDAQANFAQAKGAYQARDFDRALQFLDRANGAPDQATAGKLRAAILLEQNKLDEANAVLRKLEAADPVSWEVKYLLARISLRKKDYEEARARLEALLLEPPPNVLQKQDAQLIKYQIFLAFLVEGKESAAQQRMDQFKFTDGAPALYYAQAAWSFQHHNPKQAKEWVASADKLFSHALNSAFTNPLADLGWFSAPPTGTAALAVAPTSIDAAPSPQSAPVQIFAPSNSSPNPVVTEKQISPTPEPPAEMTPAPARIASARDRSPAVAASVETEVSEQAGTDSLGEPKEERRRQGVKSTLATSQTSPTGGTEAREAGPVVSAATVTAAPLPPDGPTATPRPPFLRRLSENLFFSQGGIVRRPAGALVSPAVPKPAKRAATPAERRGGEN